MNQISRIFLFLLSLSLIATCIQAQEILFHKMERQRSAVNRAKSNLPESESPLPSVNAVRRADKEVDGLFIISGTHFDSASVVTFGGRKAKSVKVISDSTIQAEAEKNASWDVVVTNSAGSSEPPGGSGGKKDKPETLQALADFTAPLDGQGVRVVPTPTLLFTQIHNLGRFGFDAAVWGNSLSTDSSISKSVTNFLSPQTSSFGLKVDLLWRCSGTEDSVFAMAVAFQFNSLLKKLSSYEGEQKKLTAFNPFVIHPRAGITMSFFKNNFFVSGYLNALSVVTENEQFKGLFKTKKSMFVYPDVSIGGIFSISSDKQMVKVQANMVVNNGETGFMYNSQDKIIPYLHVALVSKL